MTTNAPAPKPTFAPKIETWCADAKTPAPTAPAYSITSSLNAGKTASIAISPKTA